MKQFVVAYMNFYDNDLILEIVEAQTEQEARWKHSKLESADWNRSGTDKMDGEEFKRWCFDVDMMVSVIEIEIGRLLKVVTVTDNPNKYPEYAEALVEYPILTNYIEDETATFVIDPKTMYFWPISEFFHLNRITTFEVNSEELNI